MAVVVAYCIYGHQCRGGGHSSQLLGLLWRAVSSTVPRFSCFDMSSCRGFCSHLEVDARSWIRA
jgi:hypothetical protein